MISELQFGNLDVSLDLHLSPDHGGERTHREDHRQRRDIGHGTQSPDNSTPCVTTPNTSGPN
ncbi:hypothetical protein ACXC9Q_17405 [Kribbella sp. CWNU-51]